MVTLTKLEDPACVYSGEIFWDSLRPGLKLTLYGPRGCVTSLIEEVAPVSIDAYLIKTRNSSYLLTKNRNPSAAEITRTKNAQVRKPTRKARPVPASVRHVPPRRLEVMEVSSVSAAG